MENTMNFTNDSFPLQPEKHFVNCHWKMVAAILVYGVFILLTIVMLLLWKLYKMNKNRNLDRSKIELENNPGLPLLVDPHNLDDVSISSGPCLQIGKFLFEPGVVIEETSHYTISAGRLINPKPISLEERITSLDVLAKRPKNTNDITQMRMIRQEFELLGRLDKHPNILPFLGRTDDGFQGQNFDNQLSEQDYNTEATSLDSNLETLSTYDLLSFAYQIANGMRFLSCEYVHRCLTIRNIFLAADKTVKIGNFSLAREHGNNQYYKLTTPALPIPTTHSAPETFDTSDEKRFTEQSDVWSFGVCLFELFSLGEAPYDGVDDVKKFVGEGGRLEKPEYCHQEIYDFMLKCWDTDPFQRPVFSKCMEFLEQHMDKYGIPLKEQIDRKLRIASDSQSLLDAWTTKMEDSEEYEF